MDSSLSAPVSSGLVQPLGPFRCFTRVHVHSVLALLAAHSAAPVELALALGDARDARGVVPPPAAHHLAAVRPARHLVAHATGRAQGAWGRKRERVRVFLLHLVPMLLPPPTLQPVTAVRVGCPPSAVETSDTAASAEVRPRLGPSVASKGWAQAAGRALHLWCEVWGFWTHPALAVQV